MSDNLQQPAANNEQTNQPQIPLELRNELAMAFGEKPEAAVVDTPPTNGVPPAAVADTPPPDSNEESFDESVYLKNHFGVEDINALKAEYLELKKLKESPQSLGPKFADENSKKYYEYFTGGKEEELYNALHTKQQLKNLDTLGDEQRIKLYIKLNNPLFDQDLIDYQFDKEYKFDESQFKDEDGVITDQMGLRYAKAAAQQRMQNDLYKANEYFNQFKAKVELPNLPIPQSQVDADYEDFKASNAKSIEDYNKVIVPSVNALKESDVQFNVKVEDANNQMNFEMSIIPDKEDFETARKDSLNFGDFVQKAFYDDKGNFHADKLQRLILLEKNFDKYVQSAARQAVNAERKRVIEKEKGSNGTVRDFDVLQPDKTDLQKQADMAFAV